jgi:Holliday junction resolvase
MPNANYKKGRRAEYKAIEFLEEKGFQTIRAAGSKGIWDIFAWKMTDLVFIQVKSNCKPTSEETKALKEAQVFIGARKEVWLFMDRRPLTIMTVDP